MATYQVNAEMIAAASSGVRGSMAVISAEVASLMAQLTNLQSSWTGAAATAFTGVASGWQATQKQVEESLANINAALTAAGQTYTEAEDRAMSLFAAGR
ncbi:MAG: WXG100 family type VII secretion target [Bifidobacteriaceae bacterium]|jgi:WXG100 family type VII secretion target|nr:WXG100 family type VII secretion target [Bifidobacteriaceae bacterium]